MSLYELWVYEGGVATRVETARYEHTLRLLWGRRGYRDAAIAMDGELLEHKAGTEPMALSAIAAAAILGPPTILALRPKREAPPPPIGLEGTIWEGCDEEPDYAEVAAVARAEGFGEDEEAELEEHLEDLAREDALGGAVVIAANATIEPVAFCRTTAASLAPWVDPEDLAPPTTPELRADELAPGPELVTIPPVVEDLPEEGNPTLTVMLADDPPVALTTVPAATLCAARGCAGTAGPGPASPELAGFCLGHRGVLIRAAKRLGVPHPAAALAMRLHGAVSRATVNLSRLAA